MADNRISETRQPAEADRKDDDPLAELARIVGFDDEGRNAADSSDDGHADSGFDLEAELMRELEIDVASEDQATPDTQVPDAPFEQVQEEIQTTSSKRANDMVMPMQPEPETGQVSEKAGAWPHATSGGATTQMTSLEAELQAAFSALEGDARKPEPVPVQEPVVEPEPVAVPLEPEQPVAAAAPEAVRMPQASTDSLETISESDDLKQAYDRLQRDLEATKTDEPVDEGGSLTDMLLAEMAEVEAQASEAVADVPDMPFDPADIAETDATPEAMSDFAVPDYDDGADVVQDPNEGNFGLPLEDELDMLSGPEPVTAASANRQTAQSYEDTSQLHDNVDLEPAALDGFDDDYDTGNLSAVNNGYDDPELGGYDDGYDPDEFPGDDDFSVDDLAAPEYQEAGEEQGGRRGMVAAIVVLVIAVVGGGGFYWWNSSLGSTGGSGEPPVISADNDPVKVKPEDPGGKTVPNQDLAVYDRVAGNETSGAAEQSLVTTTEEPVDVVQRTLDPETLPLEGRATTQEPSVKVEERLTASESLDPDPTAADGSAAGVAPRKVRTLIVRPDGTIVAREAPEPAEQTATVSTQTVPSVSPATSSDASAQSANSQSAGGQQTASTQTQTPATATSSVGTSSAPANEVAALPPIDDNLRDSGALPLPSGKPAVEQASPATGATQTQAATATGTQSGAPVPATRPSEQPVTIVEAVTERGNLAGSPPAANPGGYMMQISSQPSEAAARASYENLSQRYASIIGGRGVDFQRADIPNRGVFYRVRIPAGSKDDANNLCSRYKAAGGSCFVAR
ncbi:SPOR domain-containing protein [Hoeflea prorocentri]|uniref:SPOR domain-containing protein n=1 Tax=Hoeflea prorocentri TaxID=1922333 RepID=A0A9X3ZGU0_9HYPH|nr:SPOR domain-containing protein [Hoeflea prorocentri]MCY6380579.1 SPOR domain-containing protein [Hoeflea prorocentri]MDA5398379.1 SPOR domain-containing protein [Hoeflea prorocentri]